MNTNSSTDHITLSIDQFESVPKQFSIFLFDKDVQTAVDLRNALKIEIPATKKEMMKNFRIVIGTKEYIDQNNLGIAAIPVAFTLSQNYPNPFNPSTNMKFTLPQTASVSVKIFDLLGREVKTLVNGVKSEGYYIISWDATNTFNAKVASGIYFCRLDAKSIDGSKTFAQSIKMILMK